MKSKLLTCLLVPCCVLSSTFESYTSGGISKDDWYASLDTTNKTIPRGWVIHYNNVKLSRVTETVIDADVRSKLGLVDLLEFDASSLGNELCSELYRELYGQYKGYCHISHLPLIIGSGLDAASVLERHGISQEELALLCKHIVPTMKRLGKLYELSRFIATVRNVDLDFDCLREVAITLMRKKDYTTLRTFILTQRMNASEFVDSWLELQEIELAIKEGNWVLALTLCENSAYKDTVEFQMVACQTYLGNNKITAALEFWHYLPNDKRKLRLLPAFLNNLSPYEKTYYTQLFNALLTK